MALVGVMAAAVFFGRRKPSGAAAPKPVVLPPAVRPGIPGYLDEDEELEMVLIIDGFDVSIDDGYWPFGPP